MKKKKETSGKRVFARLLAYEIKNPKEVRSVLGARGLTGVKTTPAQGSPDFTNLEWDNDGPEEY